MEPWVTPWSPVTDWFTLHPFPATDKNECLNSTACPLTATCKNTRGSYLCVCNPGFETPDRRAQFTGSRGTCIGKQILWRLPVKISLEKELTKTNNASVQILLPYANNLSIPQYLSTVIWYSCLCVHNMYVCVSVASASSVLCHPMDCSPPGCSVHGILQARILEGVAISFSKGYSQPRDQTLVSHIAGRFIIVWATREAQICFKLFLIKNFLLRYLLLLFSRLVLSSSLQLHGL